MSRLPGEITPLGETHGVLIFPESYPQVTIRVLALKFTEAIAYRMPMPSPTSFPIGY
jgi:hypothetical protein